MMNISWMGQNDIRTEYLDGKPHGRRQRYRWENNIKMALTESYGGKVNWIEMT
jgi:hypothetical protein